MHIQCGGERRRSTCKDTCPANAMACNGLNVFPLLRRQHNTISLEVDEVRRQGGFVVPVP